VNEPLWLRRAWVDALHFRQLQRFGGRYGVRDDNTVESALARPHQQWACAEQKEMASLAAAYGDGLARNHGYSDGNKPIAFVAMAVFLELNGWTLHAPEADVVRVMLAVATGTMSEAELAGWVRAHLRPAAKRREQNAPP
jgi:death-on-curing protein